MKDEILDNCEGLPLAVKTLAEIISIQIWKKSHDHEGLSNVDKRIWLRVDVHDSHSLEKFRIQLHDVYYDETDVGGKQFKLATRKDPFILWKESGQFCFTEITRIVTRR
ncbi:Uncharacterized protein Adt_40079 [Abeliophyllum distichum]|uniref:NB-ARC domain-containing protein n=1 Tax=Abeliophyllum distichum TaxID=126358 RepID=A0ABD1Q6W8_9LAMI